MAQSRSPVLFAPFLLATDGSPSACLAQRLLTTIAQTVQAAANGSGRSLLTVITVEPRRSSRSKRRVPKTAPVSNQSATLTETTVAAANHAPTVTAAIEPPQLGDQVAATIQASIATNLPISVQVRQGRPAIEILNCARTLQAGLIAVGSGGTSGIRGRLLGSVSAIIARYAPCSVLVARGLVTSDAPTLHHLLLVVNDSPATQHAIATARQLLPAGVRQVTILYAQPPLNADYLFGPFVAPTPSWQLNRSLQDAQNEQSEHILQQAHAALDQPNVVVQTLRQTSEAGPLICQVAQQQQVDLIILGGNATRRWLRLPPGDTLFSLQTLRRPKPPEVASAKQPPVLRNTRLSVTEDYILHHAPCPVLLCRATPVTFN